MCPWLSGRMSRNASVSLSSWSMVAGACFCVILQNMQCVVFVVDVFTCLCLVLLLVSFLFVLCGCGGFRVHYRFACGLVCVFVWVCCLSLFW